MTLPVTTILLHGLGRDRHIMQPIERVLNAHQMDVYNVSYASTRYDIPTLARQVADRLTRLFPNQSLRFVAHSLGGILVRYMLYRQWIQPTQRLIMLGTPNHGTPIVNVMRHFARFRRLYGPAALDLATDAPFWQELPDSIDCPCTIIAGNHTLDPWFSWTILKGPDDGKVTVESTKLNGMEQHIVLPLAHRQLPGNALTHRHILNALKIETNK